MVDDVRHDQFVVIKVEGMHCHKCEQSIQKALARIAGVHEVEVDFNSGLASVLFDPRTVAIKRLVETVNQSGYRATGFTRSAGTPKSE